MQGGRGRQREAGAGRRGRRIGAFGAEIGDHAGIRRCLGAGAGEFRQFGVCHVRHRWCRLRCWCRRVLRMGARRRWPRLGCHGCRCGRGWRMHGLRLQQQGRHDLLGGGRPRHLVAARDPDHRDAVRQQRGQRHHAPAPPAACARAGARRVRIAGGGAERIQDRRKAVVRPAASAAPAGRRPWYRMCSGHPGRAAPGTAGRWRRTPAGTSH